MAKRFFSSPRKLVKFREASSDLLTDFLTNLNERNKNNINCLSKCSGIFKCKRLTEATTKPHCTVITLQSFMYLGLSALSLWRPNLNTNYKIAESHSCRHLCRQTLPEEQQNKSLLTSHEQPFVPVLPVVQMTDETIFKEMEGEYIFLLTQELSLDPLIGYHAVELLQRFMVKHLTDLLTTPTPQGAAADLPRSNEDSIFDSLKEKFPLIVVSCVQLASKLSMDSCVIDNNTAVHFLHSIGHSVSKQALVETELMILNGLNFRLNAPNPLTYVEILLEVLGHNDPSVPVEQLYDLCCLVLQFVSLQRTAIYDALLRTTTQCVSPSKKQREKFVTVTEDYMLLGVGVIAVATFTLYIRIWEQVVGELSHITGISRKSINDFAYVTIMHIVMANSP